jgi:hypothetical protein
MAKIRKVPKKYTSGLSESTSAKRKAEIRKRAKGKDSYKPLPGDAKAKTKESKYTKSARKLRDEIRIETTKAPGKDRKKRFIHAASKVTKIPKSIIETVYDRGLAAWASGHRPGASAQQWAYARVYSFLTGGKTTKMADSSLYIKAKKILKEKNSDFRLP